MDRLRNVIVLLRGQLWIIPLVLSGLALSLAYLSGSSRQEPRSSKFGMSVASGGSMAATLAARAISCPACSQG